MTQPHHTSREAAWLTALGLGAIVLAAVAGQTASPKSNLGLHLHRAVAQDSGLNVLTITYKRSAPLTIQKITVNDREECTHDNGLALIANAILSMGQSQNLKLGDKFQIASGCELLKVHIQTDLGYEAFAF